MVKASELFTNKEDRDILRKTVEVFHGKIVRITDMEVRDGDNEHGGTEA